MKKGMAMEGFILPDGSVKPSYKYDDTEVKAAIQTNKDNIDNLGSRVAELEKHGGVEDPTKADKVSSATAGNLASLDENGNLQDSDKKPADFAPASGSTAYAAADHDHAGVYSPVGHNHDSAYAAKVHRHSDYDVVIQTLADKIFNPSKERTWTTIDEVEVISGASTGGNKYSQHILYNLEHYADYAIGDLIRLVKKSDNTKIYEGVIMQMETQPAGISVSIDLNAVTDTTDYYLQKAS